MGMDHHCVWLNSCVGYNNLRYFLLMQLYSLLFLISALLSLREQNEEAPYTTLEQEPLALLVAGLILVVSLYLGIALRFRQLCFAFLFFYRKKVLRNARKSNQIK